MSDAWTEAHTVHSQLRPYIDVALNGRRVGRIDFLIDLSVRLEAAILVIRDGRFMEVRTGRSTFEGTVTMEGARLAHTEKARALPGHISFGDGIPIGPRWEPETVAPTPPPMEPVVST